MKVEAIEVGVSGRDGETCLFITFTPENEEDQEVLEEMKGYCPGLSVDRTGEEDGGEITALYLTK